MNSASSGSKGTAPAGTVTTLGVTVRTPNRPFECGCLRSAQAADRFSLLSATDGDPQYAVQPWGVPVRLRREVGQQPVGPHPAPVVHLRRQRHRITVVPAYQDVVVLVLDGPGPGIGRPVREPAELPERVRGDP